MTKPYVFPQWQVNPTDYDSETARQCNACEAYIKREYLVPPPDPLHPDDRVCLACADNFERRHQDGWDGYMRVGVEILASGQIVGTELGIRLYEESLENAPPAPDPSTASTDAEAEELSAKVEAAYDAQEADIIRFTRELDLPVWRPQDAKQHYREQGIRSYSRVVLNRRTVLRYGNEFAVEGYTDTGDSRGRPVALHGEDTSGAVTQGNKRVSDQVPEPQRSFLTYAVEKHHGFAHQLKWARMLLATGYEWKGVVGRQLQTVFEAAERDGPLSYNDCLAFYERHGRNARWTKAKNWFQANNADDQPPSVTVERKVALPAPMASAVEAGDWAEVARLAQERI